MENTARPLANRYYRHRNLASVNFIAACAITVALLVIQLCLSQRIPAVLFVPVILVLTGLCYASYEKFQFALDISEAFQKNDYQTISRHGTEETLAKKLEVNRKHTYMILVGILVIAPIAFLLLAR